MAEGHCIGLCNLLVVKVHYECTEDAIAANYEVSVTREHLCKATTTFQAAAKDKAAHLYSIFHRV